jgi:hypothetical protein
LQPAFYDNEVVNQPARVAEEHAEPEAPEPQPEVNAADGGEEAGVDAEGRVSRSGRWKVPFWRTRFQWLRLPVQCLQRRRDRRRVRSSWRLDCRGQGKVRGLNEIRSRRFRATCCERYCLTIPRSSVFRT